MLLITLAPCGGTVALELGANGYLIGGRFFVVNQYIMSAGGLKSD